MTRTISLLLVGLLFTAALAVDPSEPKRVPESDECAGAATTGTDRPELQRLPSVLVSKTVKRSPGVDALWQAAPAPNTSGVAAPPARLPAPVADENLPVAISSSAKSVLAPAPLPVETSLVADVRIGAPAVVQKESVPVAPAPVAAKPAPAVAPVEAPVRLAPVVAQPAPEQPLFVAAAPANIQPAAMPMPVAPVAPANYGPGYESCPPSATGDACNLIDGCHGCEGWFAHIRRKKHENAGCAELFCEAPLGASVYAAATTQINKGLADRTILYLYDFQNGAKANELSPRGRQQLEKIADLMLNTGLTPLVIETAGNPQLDEARRVAVLRELKALEPSFADASVVVARPRTIGLRGDEAVIIDDNNLQNTLQRGGLLPALEGFGTGEAQ